MPAILRNEFFAVLRKGQQIILQFDVIGAAVPIRADIDERLVAERMTVFLGDGVGLRPTFATYPDNLFAEPLDFASAP